MTVLFLFLVFILLLVIAIPVSISLGISSVLPSVLDPSFTVGAKYVIRSMFGGLDSFPLLAVPMLLPGQSESRHALRGHRHLPVLRRHFRFRSGYCCGGWFHDHSGADLTGL